ncbi:hypothetical protein PHLH5_33140 [Pseudomonas sp. Cab53]|nr:MULTISPECIES: hypothetical protein [Pseudomonas]BBP65773.1 hypothetical protein PHLH5_33140 [Pseudomonas sp. Cab53]GFM84556.1 hypothetical protein PSCICN_52480 [Pseudomonas cichorii]
MQIMTARLDGQYVEVLAEGRTTGICHADEFTLSGIPKITYG